MNLAEIIHKLDLAVLTAPNPPEEIEPNGAYTSDLLSCVMAGAPHKGIWITLQAHNNIVAVAALLELSAIIITEGAMPDTTTIEKATAEGITLLSTPLPTYPIAGRLWEMGIHGG